MKILKESFLEFGLIAVMYMADYIRTKREQLMLEDVQNV